MKNILLGLLVFTSTVLTAQNKSNFLEDVRFGGGFGLNFGNNTTNIAISPTAIYDFNDSFSAGISLGYQYAKRNDFSSNVFTAGALALFNPIDNLQASAEFEQFFVNTKIDEFSNTYNYPALNLGLAYRIGRNFSLGMRYDVLYNDNKSIYSSPFSPIIRVFF